MGSSEEGSPMANLRMLKREEKLLDKMTRA